MKTNEKICNDTSEDVIVLGVASVETKGNGGFIEALGDDPLAGISDA